MNEKFSLKWNDYHSNWTQSLSYLRNDKESADVTLISEDKVKFTAHKILLSSCSKTFKFILKGNFNTNPLLFLSGVSSINLGFILDYIYYGEVNLFQEQLDNFLDSAQKLEIEGLQGDNTDQQNQDTMWQNDQKPGFQEQDIEHIEEHNEDRGMPENSPLKTRNYNREVKSNNHLAKFDAVSMTAEDIELKKKELYQKNDGAWSCLACAYTSNRGDSMRKHVETHMDGLCYTCTLCNKEFRSENALRCHKYQMHR